MEPVQPIPEIPPGPNDPEAVGKDPVHPGVVGLSDVDRRPTERRVLDGARLDGLLERIGFAPPLTIALGLIVGFLAFQGLSLVVAFAMIFAGGEVDTALLGDVGALLARYAREFLIANTVGQVVGLLALAYVFARLHTRQASAFLRFRAPDVPFTLLSVVGLIALVPLVHWLGTVSDGLPWPESIRNFEAVQMDLIEQVLKQDLGLVFTLLTMAVTPAICEEAFFRGYIQRQAERTFSGPMAAVLFSGIVFGLYHLRLTQALPLSVLGIYLAWITWRSRSLWPAVLVHFANNGLAVVVGGLLSRRMEAKGQDIDSLEIPLTVILPAIVVAAAAIYALERRARSVDPEA